MAGCSTAFKAKAVARLLSPESATLEDVSRAFSVRADTLSRWRAEALRGLREYSVTFAGIRKWFLKNSRIALRMIGYRYFRTTRNDWRIHHGALIPLSMPHTILEPSFFESVKLLFRFRALFIRWEQDFDNFSDGEWWQIIKDQDENFDCLSRNTRSKVRRGKKCFTASPSTRKEIFEEGYNVYISAFDRYETFEKTLSTAEFQEAINALPSETEFWVVREKNNKKLVAFSENIVRDNACFYNTIWFHPEALRSYAGYVLFLEMNTHYLNDRRLGYVSDGARSISHQTNIQEFLQKKFGFRKAYSSLRIRYFPGVEIVIRLIYPFRNLFANSSSRIFQKISVLLMQESIRRSCQPRGG